MTTVTAPLPLDTPVAAILARAADHADTHYGPTRYLVADAIGAALGYHQRLDVDFYITPAVIDPDGPWQEPHPAYRAVMTHLAVDAIQSVWRWSAQREPREIADLLREVATRAAVTCMSCGAEYGQPHQPWCEFRIAEVTS